MGDGLSRQPCARRRKGGTLFQVYRPVQGAYGMIVDFSCLVGEVLASTASSVLDHHHERALLLRLACIMHVLKQNMWR